MRPSTTSQRARMCSKLNWQQLSTPWDARIWSTAVGAQERTKKILKMGSSYFFMRNFLQFTIYIQIKCFLFASPCLCFLPYSASSTLSTREEKKNKFSFSSLLLMTLLLMLFFSVACTSSKLLSIRLPRYLRWMLAVPNSLSAPSDESQTTTTTFSSP